MFTGGSRGDPGVQWNPLLAGYYVITKGFVVVLRVIGASALANVYVTLSLSYQR